MLPSQLLHQTDDGSQDILGSALFGVLPQETLPQKVPHVLPLVKEEVQHGLDGLECEDHSEGPGDPFYDLVNLLRASKSDAIDEVQVLQLWSKVNRNGGMAGLLLLSFFCSHDVSKAEWHISHAPKSCDAETGVTSGAKASGAEARMHGTDPMGDIGHTGHATGIIGTKNAGSDDGGSSGGIKSRGVAGRCAGADHSTMMRKSPASAWQSAMTAPMPWTSPAVLTGRH